MSAAPGWRNAAPSSSRKLFVAKTFFYSSFFAAPIPLPMRDAWINSKRSERFWAARKISQGFTITIYNLPCLSIYRAQFLSPRGPVNRGFAITCYNIRLIVCGLAEPISDELSAVLWLHHHYPGAGVLAEITPEEYHNNWLTKRVPISTGKWLCSIIRSMSSLLWAEVQKGCKFVLTHENGYRS